MWTCSFNIFNFSVIFLSFLQISSNVLLVDSAVFVGFTIFFTLFLIPILNLITNQNLNQIQMNFLSWILNTSLKVSTLPNNYVFI